MPKDRTDGLLTQGVGADMTSHPLVFSWTGDGGAWDDRDQTKQSFRSLWF